MGYAIHVERREGEPRLTMAEWIAAVASAPGARVKTTEWKFGVGATSPCQPGDTEVHLPGEGGWVGIFTGSEREDGGVYVSARCRVLELPEVRAFLRCGARKRRGRPPRNASRPYLARPSGPRTHATHTKRGPQANRPHGWIRQMTTEKRSLDFFSEHGKVPGPPVSDALIEHAERKLGVRLPPAYLRLLAERNGGTPKRRCIRTEQPTSWAPDHIEVQTLIGIGYEDGIDGPYGSEYMTREWGYPRIGVVVFDTPAAGPDTVMLDYSTCGPTGEPRVVYVDEDRSVVRLAENFSEFLEKLTDCATFEE